MENKKRLIDANATIKWMEDNTANSEWMVNQYNADWICSMLETAPTVDAVEVKHGRWVEKSNPWGQDGSHSYDCSVCGQRTCVVGEKLHYCPNCGAKMDG